MTDPLLIDVPAAFETERLLVRTHRPGDGPTLHEALVETIDDMRRFLWFLPWVAEEQTVQSAEIRCRKCAANFLLRTDLAYLVFDRTRDRLVASVGMHRPDWKVPKVEIGYWVRTSETGRGYATEAVRTVVDWAFESLRARRIEIVTDVENQPSRKVAENCGFELEGISRNTQRGKVGELRSACFYSKVRP